MKKKILLIILCILFLTACSCKRKDNNSSINDSNQDSNGTAVSNSNSNSDNSSNSNNSNGGNGSNQNEPEVPYTLTEEERHIVADVSSLIIPIYKNLKYTELTEKEKIKLISDLTLQYYHEKTKKQVDYKKVLTKKNITAISNKYFGSNTSLKFVDYTCYTCGKSLYKFDKKKESYVLNGSHPAHATTETIKFQYQTGVYRKGNLIRVKSIVMFSEFVNYKNNEFPKRFYATYANAKNKKSPVITNISKYCTVKNGLKKYSCNVEKMAKENKFYTYVYNFEKRGNEFYFVGYEIEV